MHIVRALSRRNLRLMVANIVEAYNWADVEEYAYGASWYDEAHELAYGLSYDADCTVEAAAAVIAALSPQRSWVDNQRAAATLLAGGTPNGLTDGIRKARRIAAGEAPLDVLRGDKVRAFFDNIAHPTTSAAVCVDRHAFDIAVGRVTDDKSRKALERVGIYDLIADAYRIAAEQLGLRPHVLQAVTWTTWRNRQIRTAAAARREMAA